ncbi:MAG: hypothetical protein ACRD5J_02220, partial [Nitrososphaeraceae archaeon]
MLPIGGKDYIYAPIVDTSHIVDLFVRALSRCINYLLHPHDLASFIVGLKTEYMRSCDFNGPTYEILPLDCSMVAEGKEIPISKLNEFACHNPIFRSQTEVNIRNCRCKVFSCEIIEYWLSSKKHDACYQPFYPTWLISSWVICRSAKLMGFSELVDIGSGDARIPYCGAIAGMRGISVELDDNLVDLQREIIRSTGVEFEILDGDACKTSFEKMNLSRPMFLISGLPEHGEVLADAVVSNLIQQEFLSSHIGFALMGSHTMKKYARD